MTDRPPFEAPPVCFSDENGRTIHITCQDGDRAALIGMYEDFAPEHRAQGLPPSGRERIEEWLGIVLDGVNVVARHDERVVGHAALLGGADDHELMIFVHQAYRLAGIGSRLIRALLGCGYREGVETVWLCVRPSNAVAISMYRSVGFKPVTAEGSELEMELSLRE